MNRRATERVPVGDDAPGLEGTWSPLSKTPPELPTERFVPYGRDH